MLPRRWQTAMRTCNSGPDQEMASYRVTLELRFKSSLDKEGRKGIPRKENAPAFT